MVYRAKYQNVYFKPFYNIIFILLLYGVSIITEISMKNEKYTGYDAGGK